MTYQQEAAPPRGVGPAVTLPGGLGPFQGRRRAVLTGTDEQPDRAVLLEWVSGEDAAAQARRRLALRHVHLLPLVRVDAEADGRVCAVSELPTGADLWTVARAAAQGGEGLPSWWVVAVLAAVTRALTALHRHLALSPRCHGALHPANIFISEQGEVHLLAFSALGGPFCGAPEAALGARLCGPAADVWGLGKVLADLLPAPARAEPELSRLLAAMLAPWPGHRPTLAEVLDALDAHLLDAAPLELQAGVGEVLRRVCPQGATAAGELSELHVLGAWEDLWGGQAREQPEPQRAQHKEASRRSAYVLLGLGAALFLLSIIYLLRASGVW